MTVNELLADYAVGRRFFCDVDLSDANLSGANLSGADFNGADFNGAGLGRANLVGAVLRGADLRSAYLSDANLSGARLTPGHAYASVSWTGHGECGRQLSAYHDGTETRYFCGCFTGSIDALRAYIAAGPESLRESRTITADMVQRLIALQIGGGE